VIKFIDAETYEQIKKKIPIACVDLLILNEGKVLLLKRQHAPAQGQWWFPGGRILKGETIFDAAKRKGVEELGLMLEPQEVISVEESIFDLNNDRVDIHTINIVIRMEGASSRFSITLDDTHSEFKWFQQIDDALHPCVKNPLLKIGFTLKRKLING
jgi:colanic acid biosynthesis protein WcaH